MEVKGNEHNSYSVYCVMNNANDTANFTPCPQ